MKGALTILSLGVPLGVSLGALVLTGCGSDDQPVSIEHAWARASAVGQTTGAVYFDLTVDEDDTLVGASVPASVAADAQIHEVVMADMDGSVGVEGSEHMDDMTSGDADHMAAMESGDMEHTDEMDSEMGDLGAMTMRELTDRLGLTAGETVSFEPGSYHVMLVDIAEPLEVGDQVEVTLEFDHAASMTITVEVAASAP